MLEKEQSINPLSQLAEAAKQPQNAGAGSLKAPVRVPASAAIKDGNNPAIPTNSPAVANPLQQVAQPQPLIIDGIRYQNLPDKPYPNPLGMLAHGMGRTVSFIANGGFDSRADERLAANRAELNNDTANPSANPLAAAAAKRPAAKPAPNPVLPNPAANPLAGIVSKTTGANGRTAISNTGGAGVVDDSASALRDQQSGGRSVQQIYENMVRNRNISDMTDPTITDPAVRENAAKALGLSVNPLDQAMKAQQLESGQMALDRSKQHNEAIAKIQSEIDPSKRMAMIDSLLASQGKNPNYHRFLRIEGGEEIAPDGSTKIKRPSGVFDTQTKQFIPMNAPATGNADVTVDVKVGMPVKAPDGVHTFQGKTITVKNGKVAGVGLPDIATHSRTEKLEAPAAAIEYLKNNPSQAAAFSAKYGYLPEGY